MIVMTLSRWNGLALIVGAGGIGRALASQLRQRASGLHVVLCGRQQGPEVAWELDLEQQDSLGDLAPRIASSGLPLRLVINASGWLHDQHHQPEKRLQQVDADALLKSFSINAMAPLLLAKAVEPCLLRDHPFHFASLSARVGSITDNRSGGWYAYRGAKAAQNMYLRSLSLEWARRFPSACVTLLHPGTTDTALSRPFQTFVAADRLFSPERAAVQLLDVLSQQTPEQSGAFLAWDGQSIPW